MLPGDEQQQREILHMKKKEGVFIQYWDGGTGFHKFKVCTSLPVNYIMMQLIKSRLS